MQLHSHNRNVNKINNQFLNQLPGEEIVYTAVDKGRDPYKTEMNKYCMAMDKLVLKQHAQVMLLKNISENLVNGSRGVVVGFEDMVSSLCLRLFGFFKICFSLSFLKFLECIPLPLYGLMNISLNIISTGTTETGYWDRGEAFETIGIANF